MGPVETGRYEKEAIEERLCGLCNVVEDERHFLLDCELYENIRDPLWKMLKMEKLPDAKKMDMLLGSARIKGATDTFIGQFIINARKTRVSRSLVSLGALSSPPWHASWW